MSIPFFDKLKQVKHFVLDVDGVLTNNWVLLTEEGHQLRQMNIRDGYAIKKALAKGYSITVITGGSSDGVRKRLSKLGIANIHSGIDKKHELFDQLNMKNEWNLDEVLYMADDIPDLKVLEQVGVACCPSDAVMEVQNICHYISPVKGGMGCVRDVIEKVLTLNDDWMDE